MISDLKKLFETTTNNRHVAFTFGRFSVPHIGHGGLIKTLMKTAKEEGCEWFLFASKTHDHDRNPLTYQQKIEWLIKIFPILEEHLVTDYTIKTYLDTARFLFKEGFRSATVVVGEDDLDEIKNLLLKYNNTFDDDGFGYNFVPLNFVPALRKATATQARMDAIEGNEEQFYKDTGVNPKLKVDGLTLYQSIKYGMSK